MGIFAGIVILGLLGLFVAVGIWDRRTRRRGHRLRRSSDIYLAERDVRRNLDAAREIGANPADLEWGKPDEQRYGKTRWERGD